MSILAHFYDIESVMNVFTLANYMPEGPHLDLYYLSDNPELVNAPDFYQQVVKRVHEKNKNFTGTVAIFDLQMEASNRKLAQEFGLSNAIPVNNPNAHSNYPPEFRPVCDTDPGYSNEKHPYLMGYNSYNYDTTILAMYLHTVFALVPDPNDPYNPSKQHIEFRPTTAKLMRTYNDQLFSPRFKKSMADRLTVSLEGYNHDGSYRWTEPDYTDSKYLIRKNMLMSGRHVDVARLNEKAGHLGLKRIIGMLGGQILESDKLKPGQNTIENADQLYDLFAYNASDVINLHIKLFMHSVYAGNFSLKKKLLDDYPELVYDRANKSEYKPVVDQFHVRRDRMFIDSSSAQLATKTLCPYDHLKDIPVVDFIYPAKEKAIELGIPQVDVLEQTRQFFESWFPQPEIRAEFYRIYNFYAKYVRGHNFNQSKNYAADYRNEKTPDPEDSGNLPDENLCIPYYHADGSKSSCYAQFSIGGIHGAEYNKALFDFDVEQKQAEIFRYNAVRELFPDPRDLKKAKHVEVMDIDGAFRKYPAGNFLKTGSTLKQASYKDPPKLPDLFKNGKLDKTYTFTSADPTNHEDFKSYYPNLLRMMMAFWNKGLGYDRYADIYEQKETLGKRMKDKSLTDEERQTAAVQREGTKLILNSASGAADATFESAIRMNNNIIKMRIIGQLFSYTIAQAQTYYGAKITSTNTDGLYSVMEATRNAAILEKESANIGVEIEPEPTYLISKDTNNRIELDPNTGKIESASGGTLACQSWAGKKGPSPTKSLAHSAITDWALCEYLIFAATGDQKRASMDKPFNPEVGLKILLSSHKKMDKVRLLNMFQNVIASSPGSDTYNFMTTHDQPEIPIVMQHYNRVFIMRDNTPGTYHIYAATVRKLTDSQLANRKKHNERTQQHDPTALYVLNTNGVETSSIKEGYEATVKKVTDVDNNWFMLIENRDLAFIPEEEVDFIIENMDYGKYLYLLAKAFDGGTIDGNGKKGSGGGWRNKLPNAEPATDIREFINDIDNAAGKLGIDLPGRPANPANMPQNNAGNAQDAAQTTLPQQNTPANDPAVNSVKTASEANAGASSNQGWPPGDQELPWPTEEAPVNAGHTGPPPPEQSDTAQLAPAVVPGTLPTQQTAPQYDPNDLMTLMLQKSRDDVTETKKQLKTNLSQCVKLVGKLKTIPNNNLSQQYIANLQRLLQSAIEQVQ